MKVQPLHSAVAAADQAAALTIAEALLQAGANANARQEGGFTPLHEAALNGNVPLIRLLLAHGADPSLASDEGQRPVDLALKHGHPAVAGLLGHVA
jgi:ankyrin repeat protein